MARALRVTPAAGAIALLLAACSPEAVEPRPAEPVEIEVQRGPLTLRWSDAAVLEPARAATIRSPADGTVAILYLAPDDARVAAGEKLAELDDSALQERHVELMTQLEAARREVAVAEAALRVHAAESSASLAAMEGKLLSARFDLDTNLGREVSLEEATQERERNPWARAVDDARRTLEAAEGAAERERARLEAQLHGARAVFDVLSDEVQRSASRIESTVVRAPFAGRVVREVDDSGRPALRVGSLVRSQQPLLELVDTSSMRARMRVPAAIGEIEDGAVATVRVDAFPAEPLPGRVVRSELFADPESPRVSSSFREVWIDVDGDDEPRFRDGMSATVDLTCAHLDDVVHVPLAAVRMEESDHFVWKASPTGPVVTPVRVGRYDGERVEIVDGLAGGDRVLVRPSKDQDG